jgi:hypothetical protein
MWIFIDDHVAGAPGDSIVPIGRLLTVPVAMMAPFIRVDKEAKLKNTVSV